MVFIEFVQNNPIRSESFHNELGEFHLNIK